VVLDPPYLYPVNKIVRGKKQKERGEEDAHSGCVSWGGAGLGWSQLSPLPQKPYERNLLSILKPNS
jgi:hypothetical protein